MKKEKSIPDYELLNVANEVVFTGKAPECLAYYDDGHQNQVANVREVGTEKLINAYFYFFIARIVRDKVAKRDKKIEEKKNKKEAKKCQKKKETKSC